MALTACPECSHEVSDQAAVCPHCGYPLRATPPAAVPPAEDPDAPIRQALLGQGKIAAIQLCRKLHPGLDLSQAKSHVDRLQAALPESLRRRTGGGGTGCLLLWLTMACAAGFWGHSLTGHARATSRPSALER